MYVERSDLGVFVHAVMLTASGGYLSQVVATEGSILMGLAVGLGAAWLALAYVAALAMTATGPSLGLGVFQTVLPIDADKTVSRPNGKIDLALVVYNAAVVMLGSYLVASIGIRSHTLVLGLSVAVGLVWTAYFKFGMEDRLERLREGRLPGWVEAAVPDDEPDPDELDGDGHAGGETAAGASGEEDGYENIQAPWQSDDDN